MGGKEPGDAVAAFLADVSESTLTSRTGNRGARRSQTSRAADVSEKRLTLTHRPTGIAVEGTVPAGHYSTAQMRAATVELRGRLLAELLAAVRRGRPG